MRDSIENKEEYKADVASDLARMHDNIDIVRLTKNIENFISDNGLDMKLESISSETDFGKTSVAVQVKSDAGFLISRVYVEGYSMDDIEEIIVEDIKNLAKDSRK